MSMIKIEIDVEIRSDFDGYENYSYFEILSLSINGQTQHNRKMIEMIDEKICQLADRFCEDQKEAFELRDVE
jgi:uncharacterized protein YaaR (DUF327 family)